MPDGNPDVTGGIMQVILTDAAHSLARLRNDTDLAMARARDTALHGLKVVESVAAYELLVSNDPNEMGRTNAGFQVPNPNTQVRAGT